MVLINGRKFACEACIRGHRASSCAHTGRQLQLVRKKGRPSSQCDICRAKRVNGNFHGRCDCLEENEEENFDDGKLTEKGKKSNGRRRRKNEEKLEIFTPFIEESTSLTDDTSQANRNEKGKHSLEALMNPCQCRTTGICLCCSRNSSSKDEGHLKTASIDQPASCGCNGGDKCCDDGIEAVQCASLSVSDPSLKPIKPNCCGKGTQSSTTISTNLAPISDMTMGTTITMTTEEADAILAPDCHCGPNCACPGCLMENEENRMKRKAGNEECPDKCITCSACVLGLTRPSGIEAVDAWMDKDKQRMEDGFDDEGENLHSIVDSVESENTVNRTYIVESLEKATTDSSSSEDISSNANDQEASSSSSSSATVSELRSVSPNRKKVDLQGPSLPPFPFAKKFFDEHFLNPERRSFFSERIQALGKGVMVEPSASALSKEENVGKEFGERLAGESDEEWQARHGFQYLTPEAIKIFDHARKFKEEKRRLEQEEERQMQLKEEERVSALKKKEEQLLQLRQRALAARKKPRLL